MRAQILFGIVTVAIVAAPALAQIGVVQPGPKTEGGRGGRGSARPRGPASSGMCVAMVSCPSAQWKGFKAGGLFSGSGAAVRVGGGYRFQYLGSYNNGPAPPK